MTLRYAFSASALALALLAAPTLAQPSAPAFVPPGKQAPRELYVIQRGQLGPAELVMVQSLQGIVAQTRPEIWIAGGNHPRWLDELRTRHGVRTTPIQDPWALVDRFRSRLQGYVLCDLFADSQNVASSLAGVWGALALDASLEPVAQARGLGRLFDARGRDERWCKQTYWSAFNKDIFVEQLEGAPTHGFLRDLAAYQKAFVYHDGNGSLRREVGRDGNPGAATYGWGGDAHETEFFRGVSQGGAAPVVANYCQNLSALSQLPSARVRQPHAQVGPTEDGVHYLAFVMSDGDNIMWLMNDFSAPNWWGSPHRGRVNMGWEFNPILVDAAPPVIDWYYRNAAGGRFKDNLVCSPSGYGTIMPADFPNRPLYAQKLRRYLRRSDQNVVSLLNYRGRMSDANPFLELPEVLGVLYKDQRGGYAARRGQIHWHQGKPAVAYKHLLWDDGRVENSPGGVAQAVNAAARDPKRDQASYSLVNVHAWSYWGQTVSGTGCMDAVMHTVNQLGSHVRVVTPEELLTHMRRNFGAPVGAAAPAAPAAPVAPAAPAPSTPAAPLPPGGARFEAEALAHQRGRRDADGWSCNTRDDTPGFLAFGPYTTAIPAGSYLARFRLLVDNNSADDLPVVTVDVYDANADRVLARREVRRRSFTGTMRYQDVELPFQAPANARLETRVYWHRTSYVRLDKVTIRPSASSAPAPSPAPSVPAAPAAPVSPAAPSAPVAPSVPSRRGGRVELWNRGSQAGHYLAWNGRPLLLLGDSVTQGWQELGRDFDQRAYVDALAARGINLLMLWSYIGTDAGTQRGDARVGYDAPELWPWAGDIDARSINLRRLNPAYFNRLRRLVAYAEGKGIVVLITVHDGWTKTRFGAHPFNAVRGNGPLTDRRQYVELATYGQEMPAAFDAGWGRRQRNQYFQERFCDALIQALAGHGNVIYEMFNEGEWYDAQARGRHEEHFLGFFARRCDNLLLSNADHIRGGFDPHQNPHADVVTAHGQWGRAFDAFAQRYHRQPRRPYLLSEAIPEDRPAPDLVRTSLWSIALAGAGVAHQNNTSFGFAPLSGSAQHAGLRRRYYAELGHAARFFNASDVSFAEMAPRGALASTGMCLAQEGVEYVVYADSGGRFSVDLRGAAGVELEARYYNPRSGGFHAGGRLNGGSAARAFQAPFAGDAVLHLRARALRFQAERALHHQVGRPEAEGWSANVAQDAAGFLTFGPYTTRVPAGARTAWFRLLLDNVTHDDEPVLTLDVFDATAGQVLVERVVRRSELHTAWGYQDLGLDFQAPAGHSLELRTYWHGNSYVRQDWVQVGPRGARPPGPPPASPPSAAPVAPAGGTTVVRPNGTTMDGPSGFLWKPVSASNGKLVVLAPASLTGRIAGCTIERASGAPVEGGRYTGVHNGGREHFRFARPGRDYPRHCHVVLALRNGGSRRYVIPSPGRRYD